MRAYLIKLIRIVIVYALACFILQLGFSILGRYLLPYKTGSVDSVALVNIRIWLAHIIGEKVIGLILLSIAAFLASKANHPSWKWGVFAGVVTGATLQFFTIIFYVMRFGISSYLKYNDFMGTLIWSVGLSWYFAYLGVRQQRIQEKN